MRLLFLIIANDHFPFDMLQKYNWDRFIKIVKEDTTKNIDIFYLKEDPNLDCEYKIIENNFYLKVIPHFYYSIYQKTVEGLKYLNYQNYDFIIRLNMSSFIILDRLIDFLNTLPKTGVYSGAKGEYNGTIEYIFPKILELTNSKEKSLVTEICKIPIKYVSGAAFIISTDVAKTLAERNINNQYQKILAPDDVLIGKVLQNFNIFEFDRFIVSNIEEVKSTLDNKNCFHYRVKNAKDRNLEKDVHDFLYKHFYNYQD
jgi:hypothetical protein